MVVGVDCGEVMHGGSDADHCYELWLISGFVELWSNEHAC